MLADPLHALFHDSLFIVYNQQYVRLSKADILYVQADGSYVQVVTVAATYALSLHLALFEKQLDDPLFYRISRSCLVNLRHLSRLNGTAVCVHKHELPASKTALQALLERLPVVRTKLPKAGPSEIASDSPENACD